MVMAFFVMECKKMFVLFNCTRKQIRLRITKQFSNSIHVLRMPFITFALFLW